MKIIGSHIRECLHPRERRDIVSQAVEDLKDSPVDFDAIAFRGMSGALVVPEIADRLDKTMILVRKQDDVRYSHSSFNVEGDHAAQRYIIIDDFVSTGHTYRSIVECIENEGKRYWDPQPVGVYLYKGHHNSQSERHALDTFPHIPYLGRIQLDKELKEEPTTGLSVTEKLRQGAFSYQPPLQGFGRTTETQMDPEEWTQSLCAQGLRCNEADHEESDHARDHHGSSC